MITFSYVGTHSVKPAKISGLVIGLKRIHLPRKDTYGETQQLAAHVFSRGGIPTYGGQYTGFGCANGSYRTTSP